jgi:hypothetical protein
LEEGVIKGHMTLPNQQIDVTRPLLTFGVSGKPRP